jgi:hypothetical protein
VRAARRRHAASVTTPTAASSGTPGSGTGIGGKLVALPEYET